MTEAGKLLKPGETVYNLRRIKQATIDRAASMGLEIQEQSTPFKDPTAPLPEAPAPKARHNVVVPNIEELEKKNAEAKAKKLEEKAKAEAAKAEAASLVPEPAPAPEPPPAPEPDPVGEPTPSMLLSSDEAPASSDKGDGKKKRGKKNS